MLVHQHVDKGSESPWVLVLLSFLVYLTLLVRPEGKQRNLEYKSHSPSKFSVSQEMVKPFKVCWMKFF